MSACLSESELREWMAFYALEPFGSEVEFYRFGIVASIIANANRDPKKRGRPFTPTDFMPASRAATKHRVRTGVKPDEVLSVLRDGFKDRLKEVEDAQLS